MMRDGVLAGDGRCMSLGWGRPMKFFGPGYWIFRCRVLLSHQPSITRVSQHQKTGIGDRTTASPIGRRQFHLGNRDPFLNSVEYRVKFVIHGNSLISCRLINPPPSSKAFPFACESAILLAALPRRYQSLACPNLDALRLDTAFNFLMLKRYLGLAG